MTNRHMSSVLVEPAVLIGSPIVVPRPASLSDPSEAGGTSVRAVRREPPGGPETVSSAEGRSCRHG